MGWTGVLPVGETSNSPQYTLVHRRKTALWCSGSYESRTDFPRLATSYASRFNSLLRCKQIVGAKGPVSRPAEPAHRDDPLLSSKNDVRRRQRTAPSR